MPTEQSSEMKFGIGHVSFIETVGYSKLLITEQSEQIHALKEIVRERNRFVLCQFPNK